MSELKITYDSLENAILKDGQFVFGRMREEYSADSSIISDASGAFAGGYIMGSNSAIIASGRGANAFGYAVGNGKSIIASGDGAHAEGKNTQALEDGTHAGGIGTIANQEAMTAIGKYNVSTNTENTLFVVGDGTSSADVGRSDAFRVVNGGSSTTSPMPSSVQAKVNGISDVYLGCPIGTVVMWAGGGNDESWNASTDAPDGWLICDGRVIQTDNEYTTVSEGYEDFQKLLDIIKTKYGSFYAQPRIMYTEKTVKNTDIGNGTYNVRIPDFTKHFPLGAGYTTGYTPALGGEKFDVIKVGSTTYKSYNGSTGGEKSHKLTAAESGLPSHRHDVSANFIVNKYGIETAGSENIWDNDGGTVYTKDASKDADDAHNNIPPYLAINFIGIIWLFIIRIVFCYKT